MLKKFICSTLIGLVIAFLIQTILIFGFLKEDIPVAGQWKNCRYWHEDVKGPEDITKYNSSTLIIS